MILLRKQFSKKSEASDELKSSRKKKLAVGAGIGVGVLGLDKATSKISEKLVRSVGSNTATDNSAIKDKLLKEAKKQGTRVVTDEQLGSNASYTGGTLGRGVKKVTAKLVKFVKKQSGPEAADELVKKLKSNPITKHLGKDDIILGKGISDADVLSHELGHSKYYRGRSKNIIAKGAHVLTPVSSMAMSKLGSGLSALHGFKSGQKTVRNKRSGKKDSTWNKVKSVAVPAALVAPVLIAEGAASIKGYKMMKAAGASKELLKQSRGRLGKAFGTYALPASKPIIAGQLGREAGKTYEKSKEPKNK